MVKGFLVTPARLAQLVSAWAFYKEGATHEAVLSSKDEPKVVSSSLTSGDFCFFQRRNGWLVDRSRAFLPPVLLVGGLVRAVVRRSAPSWMWRPQNRRE